MIFWVYLHCSPNSVSVVMFPKHDASFPTEGRLNRFSVRLNNIPGVENLKGGFELSTEFLPFAFYAASHAAFEAALVATALQACFVLPPGTEAGGQVSARLVLSDFPFPVGGSSWVQN